MGLHKGREPCKGGAEMEVEMSSLTEERQEHEDLPQEIISLTNVFKTYLLGIEGVPALRGVDLRVRAGEFVIVYGTSGGGKTSLLNVIGTIDRPTKGGIMLFDTLIDRKTKDSSLAAIRMFKMGFVFQTFNLIPSMTALENVELPMVLKGDVSKSERVARAKELLDSVGMGSRLNHLPSQLSGGEQQRVTIARALVNKPDLLLLDEPTGDLDTRNTDIVMGLLMQLNEQGITMVMVTHDDSLKNCANRIVYMADGRVRKIREVTAEERGEQRRKLASASRSLRMGVESDNPPIERSSKTVIREPHQYTMRPVPVPGQDAV
eukprot:c21363_g1_i1.p1 GENE.c21363_g1_i1~~c21363_g1_i1.p1  ORF type:complete len:320 (-),score=72.21 c21363_g1_i1:77-1036(-)